MAVPPLAAKVIFEAILKSYARQPYNQVSATTFGSAQRRRNDANPANGSHSQTELPFETEALTA